MSLNVGSNSIGSIYYGNDEIVEVYKGSELVWASYSDAPQYIFRNIDENGKLLPPDGHISSGDTLEKLGKYALAFGFYKGTNLGGAISIPNMEFINSDNCMVYCFQMSDIESLSFPSLEVISGNYSLAYCCSSCTNLESVSFPKLTTVSGENALVNCFGNCQNLESISFPNLEIINGKSAFENTFYSCINLKYVNFPKLLDLSGINVMYYAFRGCTRLTDVYFNSLTTSSFGSSYTNQFSNLLSSTGSSFTHTLHFPSNLESTISKLSGYPNFGGTNGYVVLVFDLPATN